VLVEAGPQLAGTMLAAGLVDLKVVYKAAKLKGSKGRPLLELPLDTMAQSLPLRIDDIRALGGDWRISAIPENS
jgi:diaminohydroxyphosphoribosylaminopyrimidine deaminase/5-amino-6-(5-phosphoribosylamino)uracil reductase